jgi:hypothetical protein
MPKTKDSMVVVRPKDSVSQRHLRVDPELLSPPMGGSESWTSEEMIHTSSFEVAVTDKVLNGLTKHMEETLAGGDSERCIKPQGLRRMSARFLLSTASCSITVTIVPFSISFRAPR